MPFKKGEIPSGAKPFVKGESGNPDGRPPRIFRFFEKSQYTKQDFKEAVKSLFWMDMNSLKLVWDSGELNGEKVPAVVKMLAGMIWESVNDKDMSRVKDIIKYIAPSEEIEGLSGQVNEIVFRLRKKNEEDNDDENDPPEDPLQYSMNE